MQYVVIGQVAWSVGQSVTVVSSTKIAKLIKMQFGLWAWIGPKNRVRWGSRSPIGRAILRGKGLSVVKYREALSFVQKPLNRSRCRLGWGLGWVQGNVLGGVHTGAMWQLPLNRPCMAAMRPVVKLLWPLNYSACKFSYVCYIPQY